MVLITGAPDLSTATEAVRHGAFDYLQKPVSTARLRDVVERAARIRQLARVKRLALVAIGRNSDELLDLEVAQRALDRALASLHIVFQPIVDREGRIVAHEALMRTREELLPSPTAVLDAALRLGRLQDVGRRTRERIAEAIPELPSACAVYVNLHTNDLNDLQLCSSDSPLTPFAHRTVLELTERASLDEVPDPRGRVAELRCLGFRIAIDDLGAGYAGLNSFTLLEPDIAKIDMALVRGVHANPKKKRVVGAIASLCRQLGVVTVAEGIETAAELDTILSLGCDLLQGFLLAQPCRPAARSVDFQPCAG